MRAVFITLGKRYVLGLISDGDLKTWVFISYIHNNSYIWSRSRSRISKVSVLEGVVLISNGQVSVSNDQVSVSALDSEAETPFQGLIHLSSVCSVGSFE